MRGHLQGRVPYQGLVAHFAEGRRALPCRGVNESVHFEAVPGTLVCQLDRVPEDYGPLRDEIIGVGPRVVLRLAASRDRHGVGDDGTLAAGSSGTGSGRLPAVCRLLPPLRRRRPAGPTTGRRIGRPHPQQVVAAVVIDAVHREHLKADAHPAEEEELEEADSEDGPVAPAVVGWSPAAGRRLLEHSIAAAQ